MHYFGNKSQFDFKNIFIFFSTLNNTFRLINFIYLYSLENISQPFYLLANSFWMANIFLSHPKYCFYSSSIILYYTLLRINQIQLMLMRLAKRLINETEQLIRIYFLYSSIQLSLSDAIPNYKVKFYMKLKRTTKKKNYNIFILFFFSFCLFMFRYFWKEKKIHIQAFFVSIWISIPKII